MGGFFSSRNKEHDLSSFDDVDGVKAGLKDNQKNSSYSRDSHSKQK